MVESNCITLNFPKAVGGHMLGRMIACCENVAWYDLTNKITNNLGCPIWEKTKTLVKCISNKRFKGAKP